MENQLYNLLIFTRGFHAILCFEDRDLAEQRYKEITGACVNVTVPQLITAHDDRGARISFSSADLIGLKIEPVQDRKEITDKNVELLDLQIEYHKLLIKQTKERDDDDKWKYD